MPKVAALHRYPVKGFTPESCESLTVLDSGRVAGDRVLAFRMATEAPGDGWAPKPNFIVMMNTPGLARLTLRYHDDVGRLSIACNGSTLVVGGLESEGRARLAGAVAEYVSSLQESPLVGHPERLPLRLVGDGVTPQFQDSREGRVTLHGRGSLASLGDALGDGDLNERRFRTNISVEGTAPWEELSWEGRRLRVGRVRFAALRPLVRCLATHANPLTGERDRPVLTTLTGAFGQEKPTFGIALMLDGPGGVIHVGDEVTLLDE